MCFISNVIRRKMFTKIVMYLQDGSYITIQTSTIHMLQIPCNSQNRVRKNCQYASGGINVLQILCTSQRRVGHRNAILARRRLGKHSNIDNPIATNPNVNRRIASAEFAVYVTGEAG